MIRTHAINAGFDKGVSAIRRLEHHHPDRGCGAVHLRYGPVRGFAVTLCLGIPDVAVLGHPGQPALIHLLWGRQRKLEALRSEAGRTMGILQEREPLSASCRCARGWYAISGVLIAASLLLVGIRGLNLGIDFTGAASCSS